MADLSRGTNPFPRAPEVSAVLYSSALGSGDSDRQRTLARLDDFYRCREYDHLEWSWEGLKADKVEVVSPEAVVPTGMIQPMEGLNSRARRPVAPLRLSRMVVDRFTELLFSESRIPKMRVSGDDDAHDFLVEVFKTSKIWRTLIQARTQGGSMGSSLIVVSLDRGRFSFSAISPRRIREIEWEDADRRTPRAVLIQYDYEVERQEVDGEGRPVTRTSLMTYRRIVDSRFDITYEPTFSEPGRAEPHLVPAKVIEHGLGRFPGVWIQNLVGEEAGFDGEPDCAGAYQIFEAIDRLNSQSYRGLNYNQDPTLVYGRDVRMEKLQLPLRKGSENALNVGSGGQANYLEISGSGITVSIEFVKLLRQGALDLCQCVLADPQQISGAAQSAKAIEYIYAPMLAKAGKMRLQYGEAIAHVGQVVLDLARLYSSPVPYSELEGNVVGGRFALSPRQSDLGSVERVPGNSGTVELEWGPFFEQTNTDRQSKVSTWTSARGATLAPLDAAARGVAEALGVSDVEGYVAAVLEEVEADEAKRAELDAAMVAGDELREVGPVVEDESAADALGVELMGAGEDLKATATAQAVALNGAQVQAASDIVARVATGELPKSAGVEMLVGFFGLPREIVEAIFRGI